MAQRESQGSTEGSFPDRLLPKQVGSAVKEQRMTVASLCCWWIRLGMHWVFVSVHSFIVSFCTASSLLFSKFTRCSSVWLPALLICSMQYEANFVWKENGHVLFATQLLLLGLFWNVLQGFWWNHKHWLELLRPKPLPLVGFREEMKPASC